MSEQYQAKWTEYQVGQLAALGKQGVLRIPSFQRDFVWPESATKLLADSVARNYPVGSLLLLAENKARIDLESHAIKEVAVAAEEDDGADVSEHGSRQSRLHVLDGQQRLTSLVRVFANLGLKKVYYLDLARMLECFGPDNIEEPDWIISRSKGKKDAPRTKDSGRLVRADVVLDAKTSTNVIDEFIDEVPEALWPERFRGGKEEKRLARSTLTQVFETIRNYRVPAIVIDRESPLSSIVRIFETINSTGKKLNTFDLAVASCYPEPKIRELWGNSVDASERFRRFQIGGERVLQVLALWRADAKQIPLEATRTALLRLAAKDERTHIAQKWDSATSALEGALKWAEDRGAVYDLPQEPIVVSLAAFFGTHGVDKWLEVTPNAHPQLERWFFAKMLQQGAKSASNYKVGADLTELFAWYRQGVALPAPLVQLDVKTLLRLNSADIRYRTIACLMIGNCNRDLRSGSVLDATTAVEEHYIYPRSFKRHGLNSARLNSLANQLVVAKATNRNLSDTPPTEYFGELVRTAKVGGNAKALCDRLRDSALPFDIETNDYKRHFEVAAFDQFLEERAERILDVVAKKINGLLNRSPDQGSVEDDVDELL
jgi:hypothetical protein